jgi:outer membrane protein assembly factor BamA
MTLMGAAVSCVAWPAQAQQGPPSQEAHIVGGEGDGRGEVEDSEDGDPEGEDEQKPSGRLEIGAGYSPDERWILSAGIGNEHLFGSDHSLSLGARVSGRGHRFGVDYRVPGLIGGIDTSLTLETERRSYATFARESTGGSLTLSRKLSPTMGAYMGYRFGEVSIDRFGAASPVALATAGERPGDPYRGGQIAGLRAGVTYDSVNRRNEGARADLFVERMSPLLGSDFDLSRAGARASYRHALVGPVALRLEGGAEAVWSNSGERVPLVERLQFEGHSDLRGYGLGSLGSELGGNLKARGRAQLEFPLFSRIGLSGSVFYDVGMLRDLDGAGARASYMGQSVGAGLTLDTPLGPVHADIALPLDDPAGRPQFLLTIGAPF